MKQQTAVEWLMQMLEQSNIIDLDLVDSFGYYALIEQAKQMEAEQSKIPELSDEEIKEKMFGGQYDDQDINDVGEFEAAKWYREQLKQRQ